MIRGLRQQGMGQRDTATTSQVSEIQAPRPPFLDISSASTSSSSLPFTPSILTPPPSNLPAPSRPRLWRNTSLSDSFASSIRRFTTKVQRGRRRSLSDFRGWWGNWGRGPAFNPERSWSQWRIGILDPRAAFMRRWNQIFLISCLVAAFVDPLFFFLPEIHITNRCVTTSRPFAITVTILRSCTDFMYILHVLIQFRLAYIAPSSRVFGRGELVIDPHKIANHYLRANFAIDLLATLPLPQVVLWVILPIRHGGTTTRNNNFLRFAVILQYIPRTLRVASMSAQVRSPEGAVFETAWSGFVINMAVYMVAAHVCGAIWWILGLERIDTCWRRQCANELALGCSTEFFDCQTVEDGGLRASWANQTSIITQCCNTTSLMGDSPFFDYGIYITMIKVIAREVKWQKYFYALWWGLQNLASLGNNLIPSTFVGEIIFCILIAIIGLVLFALLVGNIQIYLQSLSAKLEEMRMRRRDTEAWMRHRLLPLELRRRVRKYNRYRWAATQGVDEEGLLESLPEDLRRDIKRFISLELVKKVPLFGALDDILIDAICQRLRPMLYIKGSRIIREGDPVLRMLFVVRGELDSATTGGGRTGFLNRGVIVPGGFCGEELLTWCLEPKSRDYLPASTRSITANVDTEVFALTAEDLKFVTAHFRKLHSKDLQHIIRRHSQQWRTWAALTVQAAWRRYKTLKARRAEQQAQGNGEMSTMSLGAAIYATRFAAATRRSRQRRLSREIPLVLPPKPETYM